MDIRSGRAGRRKATTSGTKDMNHGTQGLNLSCGQQRIRSEASCHGTLLGGQLCARFQGCRTLKSAGAGVDLRTLQACSDTSAWNIL
jgi:hypothetical protein